MVYVYAGLIPVRSYPFDILNKKIMDRWSYAGLKYIKEKAWKILSQLHDELDLGGRGD